MIDLLACSEDGGFEDAAAAGGGELELGEVLGSELGRRGAVAGGARVDTGDDAGDFSRDGERDSDHGIGDDAEPGVENAAVLGIGGDGVLADPLGGGVDEADNAMFERLLEDADEVVGMGAGAEGGVEVVLAREPEGGVFGSGGGGGAFEQFTEEAAGGLIDRAGGNPVGRVGRGRVSHAADFTVP